MVWSKEQRKWYMRNYRKKEKEDSEKHLIDLKAFAKKEYPKDYKLIWGDEDMLAKEKLLDDQKRLTAINKPARIKASNKSYYQSHRAVILAKVKDRSKFKKGVGDWKSRRICYFCSKKIRGDVCDYFDGNVKRPAHHGCMPKPQIRKKERGGLI